jgi:photosystem II stability/assembly factor-like uncharacterized protein
MGFRTIALTLGAVVAALAVMGAGASGANADRLGWVQQGAPTGYSLYGVALVDSSTGWVVGGVGTILATSNGGTDWMPQTSGTLNDLYTVDFTNASHGWVVGGVGTILATSNGGSDWTSQTSGIGTDLMGVSFADATHGWAVGTGGIILVTTNGGGTWSPQTSNTGEDLWAVAFADTTHGWAVGTGGTILATTNGGGTWSTQTSGTDNDLSCVWFANASHGCAAGSNGTIVTTADGGANWTPHLNIAAGAFWGVARTDASQAWAVGDSGAIYATVDGGDNWTPQISPTGENLFAVAFLPDASLGCVVGANGTILTTTSGGVKDDSLPPTTTASGSDTAWHNHNVVVTLTADDHGGSGVADTGYSIDGGDVLSYAGPFTIDAPANHSNDAVHVISFQSIDVDSNVEFPQTRLVNIDTRKPTPHALAAATARRRHTAKLRYKVSDVAPNGGTARVTIRIQNPARKVVKTLHLGAQNVGSALSAKFKVPSGWKAGTYKFRVYATDTAGNRQAKIASNRLVVR